MSAGSHGDSGIERRLADPLLVYEDVGIWERALDANVREQAFNRNQLELDFGDLPARDNDFSPGRRVAGRNQPAAGQP